MENLLNHGLTFTIISLKLDITQVLVDWRRFDRSTIWHEFWFGSEQNNDYEAQLFKSKKIYIYIKIYIQPLLKIFFNSVRSEIMDPNNRNYVKCNLPLDKLQALKAYLICSLTSIQVTFIHLNHYLKASLGGQR